MQIRMRRAAPLLLVSIAVCVGCDQATKRMAESALSAAPVVSVAADAVRLELASNAGAFLGLGAGLPEGLRRLVLIGLLPLVLLLACVRLLGSSEIPTGRLVGVALLAGGGLGNWLDRLLHEGAVTDFISIGLGGLRTGVFNFADVAVIAGVVVLVWTPRRPRPPA